MVSRARSITSTPLGTPLGPPLGAGTVAAPSGSASGGVLESKSSAMPAHLVQPHRRGEAPGIAKPRASEASHPRGVAATRLIHRFCGEACGPPARNHKLAVLSLRRLVVAQKSGSGHALHGTPAGSATAAKNPPKLWITLWSSGIQMPAGRRKAGLHDFAQNRGSLTKRLILLIRSPKCRHTSDTDLHSVGNTRSQSRWWTNSAVRVRSARRKGRDSFSPQRRSTLGQLAYRPGSRPRSEPGNRLRLAQYAQEIATPEGGDFAMAIAAADQLGGDGRTFRRIAPAADRPASVEIRADADMRHADPAHHVIQ